MPDHPCECCQTRPAITRIALPGDEAIPLCGTCLDDARSLGLIHALTTPTGRAGT